MTKEELREYRNLRREHAQLLRQIKTLEAEIYNAKPQQLSGMPGSGEVGRSTETAALRRQELVGRYYDMAAELARRLTRIEEAVNSLQSIDRIVIRAHYVEGLTWEAVCQLTNYSWKHVHRIHARALKKLAE